MSTLKPTTAIGRSLELATLASPRRLLQRSRLYATVVDDRGVPGRRHFVTDLPEGAAVFALAAPGVSFVLVGQGMASADTLLAADPIDAAGLDAWYSALLSWPGFARDDSAAAPIGAGQSRTLPRSALATAREVVWLRAPVPVLRYPETSGIEPSPAGPLLVLADQIVAEVTEDSEVRALSSTSLLADNAPEALSGPTTVLAMRIAAGLIRDDAAMARRAVDRLVRDKAEVSRAVRHLSDAAALRDPEIVAEADGTQDSLAGALAVIATREGFTLRHPREDNQDNQKASVVDRLGRFSNASGFRFREIALHGSWWQEEGPSFLGIEADSGLPRAVIWRRRRWRIVDPKTHAETAVDATAAAQLRPRGYMIYPLLPEQVSMRQVFQFTAFGARGDISRLMVGAAAATFAALLIPVTTGAVLGFAVPDGRTSLLVDMMVLLVAASVGNLGFQVVRAVALVRLGSYVDRRLQPAIWDRVMRLRTSFFRRYSVGDLTLRILGIDAIRRIFAGQTLNALVGGVFSLANLGIMLVYDAALAAFAVGYALVAAAILFLLARQKMRLERIVLARKGVATGLMMEILGGIAKLRVAAAELRAFSRWSNAFAEQRAMSGQSGRVAAWQITASTSLPILGTLGILAIAGGGDHLVEVAAFAAFNSAFAQFTGAILNLTTALNLAIDAAPLFARIRPVFEAPLEVDADRIDPGPLGGLVAVRNLSFRYSTDGPWTLDGIDFEVRPGESVAIVGISGSGKSTLLRLLLGFETPDRGGVYYDDRDLETLDLRRVRSQIGTVLETAGLVPGTIFENIAGSAPITRERVMEATRRAGLDSDIAAMPSGLDTLVTEGGSQLSGGQRQRVMIARALVSRPRLIFFDQATSALDNRTQAIVGASLAAMNATRIIIAHRLSTIRSADRIIVLEDGRVAETGTYDELRNRDGAFRRLVQRQLL